MHEFDDVMSQIQLGLASVVPLRPLCLFSPLEIEELVVGQMDIDLEYWKQKTVYKQCFGSGNTPSEKGKWLWNIIESFTPEQQRDLIKFGWGRSRLPDRNDPKDKDWKMTIMKVSMTKNTDQHLPEGHTCFFTIGSPEYSSEAQMKKKFLEALTWGLGDLDLR